MPTVARLRGRRAFAELATHGRTVRSGLLRVRFVATDNEAAVGFAIGKKYGSAVERNRLRRRLRAAVTAATTPLTRGFYVISAEPAAAQATFGELVAAVDRAATKVTATA